MAKKGRRSIRGFDPWKLRTVLESLPLQELAKLVGEAERDGSELVLKLEAALHYGIFSLREYLRAIPEEALLTAWQRLGFQGDATVDQRILDIDAALRYSPLASSRFDEEDLLKPLAPNLTAKERLLLLELHTRIARSQRSATSLSLGDLVGRMGYVDEDLAVHGAAIERAGSVLGRNGLRETPSLVSLAETADLDLRLAIQAEPNWAPEASAKVTDEAVESEREFLAWVISQMDARPDRVGTFKLADLINRLGRYQALRRLRAAAAADVAEFLHRHGLTMDPDYRDATTSPGIEALVQLQRHRSDEPEPAEPDDPVLEYALRLGMALARSDNNLDEREVEELQRHAQRRLATHSEEEVEALGEVIDRLRAEEIDVEATAERIAENLSPEEQQQVLDYLFDVAVADGVFLPQEEALLRQLHERLHFDTEYFERLIRLCNVTAKNVVHQPASDSSQKSTPVHRRRSHAPSDLRPATPAGKSSSSGHVETSGAGAHRAQRAARLYSLLTN